MVYFSGASLPTLSWKKARLLNGRSSSSSIIIIQTGVLASERAGIKKPMPLTSGANGGPLMQSLLCISFSALTLSLK